MHCCQSCVGSFALLVLGRCASTRQILSKLTHRQSVRAAICSFASVAVAFACVILPAHAQPTHSNKQAVTSDAARREAIKLVPLGNIHRKYRSSVNKVMTDCSLFRRMPTQMVDCDPQLFTFLAQNPEILVEMWQDMGISRVSLHRTGPTTFDLSDGAGTTGKLVIVEQKCDDRAQNRIVMYSEGAYEGKPFKRPVRAQCVLVLRSGSITETNGRDFVACRLDTFVRIERTSIELFAKAMHPWVGKTADANFADTVGFVSSLSKAAERRPEKIERLVNRLPRVTSQRQQLLVKLAYACSEKYDEPTSRVASKAEVTDHK